MAARRILIIDDDTSVVRVLSKVFEAAGFDVTPAHNGEQAIFKMEGRTFDAMLCDIQMPRMSGPELFLHLARENLPIPPVVFVVTSRSEEEERCWMEHFPMIRLVEKPAGPKQLLRIVQQRLADLEAHEPGEWAA